MQSPDSRSRLSLIHALRALPGREHHGRPQCRATSPYAQPVSARERCSGLRSRSTSAGNSAPYRDERLHEITADPLESAVISSSRTEFGAMTIGLAGRGLFAAI